MVRHSSPRLLARTWLVLMALTAASMVAGRVGGDAPVPLGVGGVAVILLAAGFKCRGILSDFLGLRTAAAGWRTLFWAYLVFLGLLILGAYAVAASGVPAQLGLAGRA